MGALQIYTDDDDDDDASLIGFNPRRLKGRKGDELGLPRERTLLSAPKSSSSRRR